MDILRVMVGMRSRMAHIRKDILSQRRAIIHRIITRKLLIRRTTILSNRLILSELVATFQIRRCSGTMW
ncbi:hypothetical protein AOE01nite_29770 [Acetobacter oeni]|uniref:Uncharacterized protein n=1 Tax=Acetobacter oeni TaxID=304077 RepID=A0A511XP67_9PROT|nr:hypothetical protein AOE01nite_29770 [Acetobacter oeni]